MAQYDSHATDLYVLPEGPEEAKSLLEFIRRDIANKYGFKIKHSWQPSNVPGQPWHGKCFLEFPCGIFLKEELQEKFPPKEENNV